MCSAYSHSPRLRKGIKRILQNLSRHWRRRSGKRYYFIFQELSVRALADGKNFHLPFRKSEDTAEDNVVSAANKARRILFYLKRSFAALAPRIFLRLHKTFIRPHLEYAIQATHPIKAATQRHWKRCKSLL